jgi:hypothetical protein
MPDDRSPSARRWLALLAFLSLIAACDKHTRLRVTASPNNVSADLTRLFGLFRLEPEVRPDGEVTTAKLTEELSGEDKLAIDETLRRISGFNGGPLEAPFELAVTETDGRRLAAVNLSAGKRFPLELRAGEGNSQLKSVHLRFVEGGQETTCSYDVPLASSLPPPATRGRGPARGPASWPTSSRRGTASRPRSAPSIRT